MCKIAEKRIKTASFDAKSLIFAYTMATVAFFFLTFERQSVKIFNNEC